ncbi:tyrosine-type recombinase/integrase [Streptosporangium sp. 'caverna']|uniref:tyrosine-type recombinase/integrase n=1 Tax=Streptosporangium sp. 'caverna' TaxID=2202249 RepID=UPI001EF75FF8|nr:tyrosine-type recombinase/integrase [Streptosporangium sp. 'caverna']
MFDLALQGFHLRRPSAVVRQCPQAFGVVVTRLITQSQAAVDLSPPSSNLLKGDTKTVKSRRSLKLPQRCVEALRALREEQEKSSGKEVEAGLVFGTSTGTVMSAGNVRRDIRKILEKAGLRGTDWTPREMRHSFVSLLSDSGVPIEDISRLVGHRNTVVTEMVYRRQIRPVLMQGAEAMDDIFKS